MSGLRHRHKITLSTSPNKHNHQQHHHQGEVNNHDDKLKVPQQITSFSSFPPESLPILPSSAGEVASTRIASSPPSASVSAYSAIAATTTTTTPATAESNTSAEGQQQQQQQRRGAKAAAHYFSEHLSPSGSPSSRTSLKIAGGTNRGIISSGEVHVEHHHHQQQQQQQQSQQQQQQQQQPRRRAAAAAGLIKGAFGQQEQREATEACVATTSGGVLSAVELLRDTAASRKRKPGSPFPPLAPRRKAAPPEKDGARGRLQAGSLASDMYSSYQAPGSSCRIVGNYQILETLGEGLTSKVKKGRDTRNGRVVALKVMFQQRDDRRRAVRHQRFIDEAHAMNKCNNLKHTVGLVEVLTNARYPKRDGTFEWANVLVLEYCGHGELFRLLSLGQCSQPLPSSITREYFRQLMDGILHCHSLGVAHRDIKPQNLLMDSEFNLKIADFGFAAIERPHMLCNSVVGTHAYTAPEVLGGSTMYLGPQADVWSAGIVLFRMVVGHLPMERADTGDWWFRALNMGRHDLFWKSHQDQVRFALPMDAKSLISYMLTPDPSKRITVAQIMAHPYLHGAQPSHSSLFTEMSRRFEMMRATNYSATSGTTAGSAPSSSDIGGAGPAVAAPITQPPAGVARQHNAYPFYRDTARSPGDDEDTVPPEMSADAAAAITGGFIAFGRPRDVVKSLERALHDMGAEIAGVQRDGARTFRTSFKVSAFIPVGSNVGMDSGVSIVAKVYRISGEWPKEKNNGGEDARAPDLIIVLRRKRGDYFRYGIVEKRLIARLTTAASDTPDTSDISDISDISDTSETSGTSDSPNALATIRGKEHTGAGQDAVVHNKSASPSRDDANNSGGSRRRRLFGRIFQ